MTTPDELVPLIAPHDGRYKRNYTRQVVAEFRFPTMLSFDAPEPPTHFVSALRKRYPILEMTKEVSIGLAESPPSHTHVMKSPHGDWRVAIKKESITVETVKYTRFDEMRSRIQEVLHVAESAIESDFFTRVGLRYVNAVGTDGKAPLVEWINPTLVGITQAGFTGINEMAGKLRLQTDGGGCMLQHGLKFKSIDPIEMEQSGVTVPDYVLDIDVYRDVVSVTDVMNVLDKMRLQAYSLFEWALGARARDRLSA